jgi:hypothetical protein
MPKAAADKAATEYTKASDGSLTESWLAYNVQHNATALNTPTNLLLDACPFSDKNPFAHSKNFLIFLAPYIVLVLDCVYYKTF